ncbi:RNA 2',3'-cyclic phosphodiesterase [Conexibacter stalactiti]|uniref:RNA 2',3'-cyclic phosphodiesterase n=1 Tax=Conexibacter stalactiti TaxID=1940611 RepID=A0ABU4HQ26_9ACTN|nr:RNA 2',3'-cyclic phosphodiesterase [Conexibacter stalactiti]MDW5595391.1 RNA 2',3'-cyclic phosphodiesterase [Conexibacter stalactiti]MEC5036033.1 RNA 2',3'-cyclic phosphodiesterase [Conexibacter stalactiti]
MAGERIRLFAALDLPEEVRGALVRWRAPLLAAEPRLLRPVASDALHVTLCFLGQVDAAEAGAIGAAVVASAGGDAPGGLAGEPGPVPGLALADALWLPRRAARVLAVELVDAGGALARLQARVAGALTAGGWFEPEARPFLPHVTVARVRARGNERAARELAAAPLPGVPSLAFDGAAVTLYRSHLGGGGARYEPLARADLR